MISDLIYDVGMHNGDDSAYYLSKGYRVVAIEANPILADAGATRFAREVHCGRMTILKVGVSSEAGTQSFWVNKTNSALSSFDRRMAEKFGGDVEAMEVPCLRFSEILVEHGVPYYLKIDIEGADHECLEALTQSDLPNYVSVEAHSLFPLCQLQVLGYQEFKCIPQRYHNTPQLGINGAQTRNRLFSEYLAAAKRDVRGRVERIKPLQKLWAAAHRLRKRPKRKSRDVAHSAMSPDPDTAMQRPARVNHRNGVLFPPGSSGPFGEETFGQWRTFDHVAYDWLHLKIGYPTLSNLRPGGWFDFHARLTDSSSS